MPDQSAHLNITGDATSALAAIAAVKTAIAGLTGKTINIDVKTNADRAMSSMSGLSGVTDRAAASASNHANAADRAASSTRAHAAASDQAGAAARGASQWFQDVAQWMDRAGGNAGQASGSMGQLGGSATRASAPMRQIGSSTGQAAGSMRELGANAQRADRFMVGASGSASRMSSALVPLSGGASRAGSALQRMGSSGSRSMVELQDSGDGVYRAISAVGRVIDDVGGSSGGSGGLSGIAKSVRGAASTFSDFGESALGGVSVPLRAVGMAAVFSAAGMGVLGAATAGVGLAGVAGDFMKSAQLMSEGKGAVSDFGKEFSAVSSQAATAGVPAMGALRAEARGLGHELASIGVANMANVIGGVTTLTSSATEAAHKLAPAIAPATDAAVALGKTVLGAFGNSGPEITSFADTVTANAPAIQQGLQGVVKDATKVANATVGAVGAYGQAFPQGQLAEGTSIAGGIGSLIGSAAPPLQQFSDKVDSALGITTTPEGVMVNTRSISPAEKSAQKSGAAAFGASGYTPPPPSTATAPAAPPPPPTAPTASNFVQQRFRPSGQYAPVPQRAPFSTAPPPMAPPAPPPAPSTSPPPPATPPPNAAGGISGGGSSGPTIAHAAQIAQLTQSLGQISPASAAATAAVQRVGPAAAQSMQQAGSASQSGGTGVRQSIQSMGHAAASVAPQMASVPAAVHSSMSSASSMARPMSQAVSHAVRTVAPQASAGGATIGASMTSGTHQGITKTTQKTFTEVRQWIKKVIDVGKSALQSKSPSQVFAALGASIPQGLAVGVAAAGGGAVSATASMMGQVISGAQQQIGDAGRSVDRGGSAIGGGDWGSAALRDANTAAVGGFGSGVTAMFNGVLPVASSAGLQVGLLWGRSVVDGADSVLKKTDFESVMVPKLTSALAKQALGVAGLLGPAGSGAQLNKAQIVSMGAVPTGQNSQSPVQVHVYLDGQPFDNKISTKIDQAVNDLASSISRQRS